MNSSVQKILVIDGEEASDNIDVSSKFNECFVNVGRTLAANFETECEFSVILTTLGSHLTMNFSFSPVPENDVDQILASIKSSRCGFDVVPK